MNLKKCTIDELAMELANRGEFILLMPNEKRTNGGSEVSIHMHEPKKAVGILTGAANLLEEVIKGDGKLPGNVKVLKKICGLSGIREIEVTDAREILDPWEPNKIGEYNPWQNKEECKEKVKESEPEFKFENELPKDEVEIEPEPNYDPWHSES